MKTFNEDVQCEPLILVGNSRSQEDVGVKLYSEYALLYVSKEARAELLRILKQAILRTHAYKNGPHRRPCPIRCPQYFQKSPTVLVTGMQFHSLVASMPLVEMLQSIVLINPNWQSVMQVVNSCHDFQNLTMVYDSSLTPPGRDSKMDECRQERAWKLGIVIAAARYGFIPIEFDYYPLK